MNMVPIALAIAVSAFGSAAGRIEETPSPDDVYLDGLKLLNRITETLEPIRNRNDAEAAKPTLERFADKMEEINKTMDGFKLTKEEKQKLETKHAKERDKTLSRFAKALVALQQSDAEAFKVLDPILSRLGKKKE